MERNADDEDTFFELVFNTFIHSAVRVQNRKGVLQHGHFVPQRGSQNSFYALRPSLPPETELSAPKSWTLLLNSPTFSVAQK